MIQCELMQPVWCVGIFLLVWSLASVAFDVGHRAADDVVALLHRREERLEALLVGRPVLFVDLVGDGIMPTQRWKQVPVF
jgi:hypothetical protein